MNVSTKRLLSILLSLAMVLAMLPMAVFAETATTLYVKPNANWLKDGARFAAYFFGNGETWLDCTDADGDGYYEVEAPAGYTHVIFCRMNPNAAANNWNNKWNQTSDLPMPTDSKICYVVAENSWDKGAGQWVEYTPEGGAGETEPTTASPIEYSVAGDAALCGTAWTPEDINNMMTDEDADGIYTITYTAVAAGTYSFKVTDGTWNTSWGGNGENGNYVITLTAEADVTINFNSADHTIEVVSDALEAPAETEPPVTEPFVPGVREYCLVGFINGADYGCNDDYENVGEYVFVDGKLTASFTSNSYIFVKTTDNANWFMTEAYTEETSATFVTGATEKMLVPGNVELTFTLVENEDGSVTVSYVAGDPVETEPTESEPSSEPSSEAPAEVTYYAIGTFNNWTLKDEAYALNANEDGTYSLTFAVTAGDIELKVNNGTWDDGCSWGDNGNNIKVTALTDGDITVTFDGSNVTVTGDCLGEAEKEPLTINTMHVVGPTGLTGYDWNTAENQMDCAMGVYSITFTGIKAGTYEFKFAANGTWDLNWASGVEIASGETQTAWFNAMGNSKITVAADDSTVTLSFDMTTMDIVTGEGATMSATIEAPAVEEPAKELVLGDNALSLAAGDTDGDTWTFTATEAGTLNINVTALAADDGTGVIAEVPAEYMGMVLARQYNVQINGTAVFEYPTSVEVAAGDTVTVLIFTGTGMATNLTLNLAMAAAEEPAKELVLGDNALTLAANDQDGDTWTFTATEAGALTLNVTALAYDWMGEGEYTEAPAGEIAMGWPRMYAMVINGTQYNDSTVTVTVAEGDVLTIQIYGYMAYATNLTLNLTIGEVVEPDPAEPGTSENPIVIDALPFEVTFDGEHDVYYVYTAAQDGIIVVTKPEGNYVSTNVDFDSTTDAYYLTVTAGTEVSLNPWGSNAGTYTFAYGEKPAVEDVAVYFNNSLYDWATVKAYAWNENGEPLVGEWPGSEMTQNEDGFWTINVPNNATYILFHNDLGNQTADQEFYPDYIYNGIHSGIYGVELNTNFYVTGDGAFGNWVSDNAAGLMTNNGNGIFTVTINNVEAGTYGIKVTDGSWINNWGQWGYMGENFPVTVEALSDVTVTFNLNTPEISYVATPVVTEPEIVIPTLTLKSPTLEFKDMITVNAMFTAENIDDVVEMGMITYKQKVDEWNVDTADFVIPGTSYDATTGRYIAHSQGINAKYLGDTVYLACYALLKDGSYVYTKLAPYSPVQYATNQLKNSTDTKLKQLVAAMLNYGAEAQKFFGHNTDNLANATLTDEQKALPEAYRADMVASVPAVDAAKQGIFANNKGFAKRYPAISFEGAFCINYFFKPNYTPVGDITLYYWNEAEFEAAEVLTKENASGTLTLVLEDSGEYRADIEGIAAKNLSEAVYVAAVYSDGTTEWSSGVLGYSIGAYCASQISKAADVAALAEATAVYGYHAKAYFG